MRRETLFAFDGIAVRGGIMLQHHRLHATSGADTVVNIQLPLSEGTVDKQFAHVGPWLIRAVLQQYPRAFAVGMGGLSQPLPRLLGAMRWNVEPVPFLFCVNRGNRFLSEMPLLRKKTSVRMAATALAGTGAGAPLAALAHAFLRWRAHRGRSTPQGTVTHVNAWGDWARDVWHASRTEIRLSVSRDVDDLMALYPLEADRCRCLRVDAGGRTIGWSVVLVTPMRNSDYFGNLTVGTILDCQAVPDFEATVASATRRALVELGADMTVTNQRHERWQRAFHDTGFVSRPSNYLFAASPPLMAAAGSIDAATALRATHVTRGDGDGRIHL
jgi:hypothetical protein